MSKGAYRKEIPTGLGLDRQSGRFAQKKVDAVRHRITARWNCSDAITVVGGFSDLPAARQDETRKQGSDASDIKPVYHRGTIYLA
jgi:hypothetical protein